MMASDELIQRVRANCVGGILSTVDDVRALLILLETAQAARDVWSGEACQEEQEAGNGPCGACRHCLPARIRDLERELEELNV
jgi:hypothetical protein